MNYDWLFIGLSLVIAVGFTGVPLVITWLAGPATSKSSKDVLQLAFGGFATAGLILATVVGGVILFFTESRLPPDQEAHVAATLATSPQDLSEEEHRDAEEHGAEPAALAHVPIEVGTAAATAFTATDWLYIGIFLAIAIGFAFVPRIIIHLAGPRESTTAKGDKNPVREALGGLRIAGLLLATVAAGFVLAYGEIGALNKPETELAKTSDTPTPEPAASQHLSSETSELEFLSPTPTPMATPAVTDTVRMPTLIFTDAATASSTATSTSTAEPLPTATGTELYSMATATHMSVATLPPRNPTSCTPSTSGWVAYTVQPGDTLFRIAFRAGATTSTVLQANCLESDRIYWGRIVYLPRSIILASTPVPTVGNLPRPNGVPIHAAHRAVPPTIDGNLNDFGVLSITADQVVYGASKWSGLADQSATFAVAWDASHLYLAVQVLDDVHVQTQVGINIFKGDSIDLLLDVDLQEDYNWSRLGSDDYQVGLSPGDLTSGSVPAQAYRWYPVAIAGSLPQVIVAAQSDGGAGYQLEAAVPWSVFGLRPSGGKMIGFALSSSDNDNTSSSEQQSMVSVVSTRRLVNPTTWGTLILDN